MCARGKFLRVVVVLMYIHIYIYYINMDFVINVIIIICNFSVPRELRKYTHRMLKRDIISRENM